MLERYLRLGWTFHRIQRRPAVSECPQTHVWRLCRFLFRIIAANARRICEKLKSADFIGCVLVRGWTISVVRTWTHCLHPVASLLGTASERRHAGPQQEFWESLTPSNLHCFSNTWRKTKESSKVLWGLLKGILGKVGNLVGQLMMEDAAAHDVSIHQGGFFLWLEPEAFTTFCYRLNFSDISHTASGAQSRSTWKDDEPKRCLCVQKKKPRHVCSSSGNRQLYLSQLSYELGKIVTFTLYDRFSFQENSILYAWKHEYTIIIMSFRWRFCFFVLAAKVRITLKRKKKKT